jgi:hypothetical protein
MGYRRKGPAGDEGEATKCGFVTLFDLIGEIKTKLEPTLLVVKAVDARDSVHEAPPISAI